MDNRKLTKESDVLTIYKDTGVRYTRYWVMYPAKWNDKTFEGKSALREAKSWAMQKGFKKLNLIGMTRRSREKVYEL